MNKTNSIPISEQDLVRVCDDWLQVGQNQGKWIFLILPSGSAFVWKGKRFYKIKLNEEGTSDRVVIRWWYPIGAPNKGETLVAFLEFKSKTGRTSTAQNAFKKLVEMQGAKFYIIRSIEKLMEVLELNAHR